MEFLQANWPWLLLGLLAAWFFLGRSGMGCGMGGARLPRLGDLGRG